MVPQAKNRDRLLVDKMVAFSVEKVDSQFCENRPNFLVEHLVTWLMFGE
jgi:hypothetical protein